MIGRIISCQKDTYWYKNKIGNDFEIKMSDDYSDKYYVGEGIFEENAKCYIDKIDCVIIDR